MKRTATAPGHGSSNPSETLTIRLAVFADAEALRRLAELDSAPPLPPVPMLVAEVGAELRAALPLHGGAAIADPFRQTGDLVAILAERRRQLTPPPRRAARRMATAPRRASGARSPRLGVGLQPASADTIDEPAMSLAIHLLGRPHLERAGEPVAGPRGHKAWGLIAYLLLSRVRNPSREHLAELLFTGADDPLGSLRWNLAEVRRALGAATLPHGATELALPRAHSSTSRP